MLHRSDLSQLMIYFSVPYLCFLSCFLCQSGKIEDLISSDEWGHSKQPHSFTDSLTLFIWAVLWLARTVGKKTLIFLRGTIIKLCGLWCNSKNLNVGFRNYVTLDKALKISVFKSSSYRRGIRARFPRVFVAVKVGESQNDSSLFLQLLFNRIYPHSD